MLANPMLIYLDHNATTPVDPGVRDAMTPFLTERYGNPSSDHALGREAAEAVTLARRQLSQLLDCTSNELIFTSGGTESSNLAIGGAILATESPFSSHIVTSAIEHPATLEPLRALERQGCKLTVLGCDSDGTINPKDVAAAIRPNTKLVSVMHANNEIGTIQPIDAISEICKSSGILLHVDAAQSVGKLPVSCQKLGVDLLTVAGHKFYAPKGIGGLYVKEGVALCPLVYGGGQEGGLSPGTENVAQIVALGAAAQIAKERVDQDSSRIRGLRDQLENLLERETHGHIIIHAKSADRLINTTSASFPDVEAVDLLTRTPHLCASTGAACHSHSTTISATLQSMGVTGPVARGTVRISLGRFTTADEIQQAGFALVTAWEEIRSNHSTAH
jgi:cysteine desulfurase